MRVTIAAVGRLKDGAEILLIERYAKRLRSRTAGIGPLRVVEIPEARQATAAERQADEAARLLRAVDGVTGLIALDAAGQMLSSTQFAHLLARRRDDGVSELAFLIGGPDGHGAAALDAAASSLSLGPMTLPHGLARVLLTEQVYRAATILGGHPYHRA